jgi:hypothetical protein
MVRWRKDVWCIRNPLVLGSLRARALRRQALEVILAWERREGRGGKKIHI